jgi:hypothetical protein
MYGAMESLTGTRTRNFTGMRMGTRWRDLLLLTAARQPLVQAHRGGQRFSGVGAIWFARALGGNGDRDRVGLAGRVGRACRATVDCRMDSARASCEARFEFLSSARLRAIFGVSWAVLRCPDPT